MKFVRKMKADMLEPGIIENDGYPFIAITFKSTDKEALEVGMSYDFLKDKSLTVTLEYEGNDELDYEVTTWNLQQH